MLHTSRVAVIAVALGVAGGPAMAGDADCEAAVRAIMTDFATGQEPVRHVNTTVFAGQTMKSIAYATGFNEGMAADENGVPVSLFRDGKFFTTSDQGKTWTLVRGSTQDEQDQLRDGMTWQADNATAVDCQYDVDLDGKRVHHYSVTYQIYTTKDPARTDYWVDADTGFVWKTENVFQSTAGETTITQVSEPAPDFVLPDPDG